MAHLLPLAPGHEKITLALITLFPIFVFYGLTYTFLLYFLPILLLVFIGHLFFFRDPEREINGDSRFIIAPADGTIYEIDTANGIIRIRMSLFNVHVTRTPVSGNITKIIDQKGGHWPFISFIRKGTKENARMIIHIENVVGEFQVIQIVGILARRCTSYFSVGDRFEQGERLGMIYYGSEVDIHFPPEKFETLVKKKDKMIAGQTPIAKLKEINSTNLT